MCPQPSLSLNRRADRRFPCPGGRISPQRPVPDLRDRRPTLEKRPGRYRCGAARRTSWDASPRRSRSSQTVWRPGTGPRSMFPGDRLHASRTSRPRTGPRAGSCMSPRRRLTVSPSIGCPLKASPWAVQSRRSPPSKPRLSGRPSWPCGRDPVRRGSLLGESARAAAAPENRARAARMRIENIGLMNPRRENGQAWIRRTRPPGPLRGQHPRRLDFAVTSR